MAIRHKEKIEVFSNVISTNSFNQRIETKVSLGVYKALVRIVSSDVILIDNRTVNVVNTLLSIPLTTKTNKITVKDTIRLAGKDFDIVSTDRLTNDGKVNIKIRTE